MRDAGLEKSILLSQVNFYISITFIGVFAFAAGLLIWHAATGQNPIADAMAQQLYAEQNF